MQLEKFKPLPYISPTGYNTLTECELAYCLGKMLEVDLPRFGQTMPMAVGSAFDSFVKADIAFLLKKDQSKNLLAELLKTVELPEAIREGNLLFQMYKEQGCINRLLDDGLTDIELDFKEVDFNGVKLYCKPDAIGKDSIPIDWKVSGYNSKAKIYPGWARRIKFGNNYGSNFANEYIEEINLRWGIQMLFYTWVLKSPLKTQIEYIAMNNGQVEFLTYKLTISEVFAKSVEKDLIQRWERIQKGNLINPDPSPSLCEPFNSPRPCTLICPFYAKSLGNPMMRDIRG